MQNSIFTFFIHKRAVRLLTLLCFFHFSGLNNGFACMASIAGNAQMMSFTPVVARNVAPILNPINWKSFLTSNRWIELFFRSRRVVQSSCENIVQKGLISAALCGFESRQVLQNQLSKPFQSIFGFWRIFGFISSVVNQMRQVVISAFYTEDDIEPYEAAKYTIKERRVSAVELGLWDKRNFSNKDSPPGSICWHRSSLQNGNDLKLPDKVSGTVDDIHREKIMRWIIENISGRNDITVSDSIKSIELCKKSA